MRLTFYCDLEKTIRHKKNTLKRTDKCGILLNEVEIEQK
jgi:hypothetical protein